MNHVKVENLKWITQDIRARSHPESGRIPTLFQFPFMNQSNQVNRLNTKAHTIIHNITKDQITEPKQAINFHVSLYQFIIYIINITYHQHKRTQSPFSLPGTEENPYCASLTICQTSSRQWKRKPHNIRKQAIRIDDQNQRSTPFTFLRVSTEHREYDSQIRERTSISQNRVSES